MNGNVFLESRHIIRASFKPPIVKAGGTEESIRKEALPRDVLYSSFSLKDYRGQHWIDPIESFHLTS